MADGGINTDSAITGPPSRLMALPGELQTEIWRFALVGEEEIHIRDHQPPPKEPGLLQTCRQIREDALAIYYKENIFTFHLDGFNATSLLAWSRSSTLRAHAVKKMFLLLPHRGPIWPDLVEWLKAFYHCECVGLAAEQKTVELCLAGHMFERVFHEAEKEINGKLPSKNWAAVEKILDDMRGILAVGDQRWR